jgi:hypothetical protein
MQKINLPKYKQPLDPSLSRVQKLAKLRARTKTATRVISAKKIPPLGPGFGGVRAMEWTLPNKKFIHDLAVSQTITPNVLVAHRLWLIIQRAESESLILPKEHQQSLYAIFDKLRVAQKKGRNANLSLDQIKLLEKYSS